MNLLRSEFNVSLRSGQVFYQNNQGLKTYSMDSSYFGKHFEMGYE